MITFRSERQPRPKRGPSPRKHCLKSTPISRRPRTVWNKCAVLPFLIDLVFVTIYELLLTQYFYFTIIIITAFLILFFAERDQTDLEKQLKEERDIMDAIKQKRGMTLMLWFVNWLALVVCAVIRIETINYYYNNIIILMHKMLIILSLLSEYRNLIHQPLAHCACLQSCCQWRRLPRASSTRTPSRPAGVLPATSWPAPSTRTKTSENDGTSWSKVWL